MQYSRVEYSTVNYTVLYASVLYRAIATNEDTGPHIYLLLLWTFTIESIKTRKCFLNVQKAQFPQN